MNNVRCFGVAALALVFGSTVALADKTAKAVFNSETRILSFYYDEVDHSGDNITVYSIDASGNRSWGGASSLTQVVFDVSFKDFRPKTCQSWFAWQNSSLSEFVGLENLDTREVTSFNGMFRYIPVKVLDLSHADWQKVKDVNSMVNSCGSLKTLYVAPDYALRPECTISPFGYTYSIVGGKGTTYNQGGIGSGVELARIDNPPDAPGYFTEKAVELPPEIYSVLQKNITENSVILEIRGRFWVTNGTMSVQLKSGGAVAASTSVTAYGDFEFTGLDSSTDYQVVVTSKNDYGETVNDALTVTTLDPPAVRWFYNKTAGVVSNSVWRFNATVAKNTTDMTLSTVQAWPDETSALDLSKQVTDADGVVYTIVKLMPEFGESTSSSGWFPRGRSPQCARVGELTFPKRLVTIYGNSFAYCTNMTIKGGFPASLVNIYDGAFCGAHVTGDLVLTNLSEISLAAFRLTDVTSVTFGPRLTYVGGNYNKGTFQGCANLTSVVFHVDSAWQAGYGGNFSGCSKLTEVNFQGLTNHTVALLSGSGIVKATFPAKLGTVGADAFKSANNLTTVVFEGAVPDSFVAPLYGNANRKITTYVPYDKLSTKNGSDKCWLDYAADGEIKSRNTTWSSDYAGIADLTKRPLLTVYPPGLKLILR